MDRKSIVDILRGLAFAAVLGAAAFSVAAQGFPSKNLTMVVAWPAGGASDFVGRLMAREMATQLGQNVLVENAPGAGGSIGTSKAMQAAADGHTLVLSSPLDMILAPLVFNSASYKAEEARAVALLGKTSIMLVARKDLPVANLADLIALLKANAAKPLSYCSVGKGSLYHLIGERFSAATGAPLLHVPYNGFPQCVTDIGGGSVDLAFLPIAGPFPGFVDTGALKAVAVLGDTPSARLPNTPTTAKAKGLEDFNFHVWAGIHANGKVPDAALQALNKAAYAALAKPDVRKALEATGATVFDPMSVQEAQTAYLKEVQAYQAMARAAGITRQ